MSHRISWAVRKRSKTLAENQIKDSLQQSKEDNNELVKHITSIANNTNYSIKPKAEDLWATLDNLNSTGTLFFKMPTAVIGDGFKFTVAANYNMYIRPYSGESLEDPVNGGQLATNYVVFSKAVGNRIEYECVTTGEWEINSKTGNWLTGP